MVGASVRAPYIRPTAVGLPQVQAAWIPGASVWAKRISRLSWKPQRHRHGGGRARRSRSAGLTPSIDHRMAHRRGPADRFFPRTIDELSCGSWQRHAVLRVSLRGGTLHPQFWAPSTFGGAPARRRRRFMITLSCRSYSAAQNPVVRVRNGEIRGGDWKGRTAAGLSVLHV